jgi:Flp pilus assembly protein TadD
LVYYHTAEYDNAIADFTEAIQLKPEGAEAYYGRGIAYEQKGETANAQRDFAQAERVGHA